MKTIKYTTSASANKMLKTVSSKTGRMTKRIVLAFIYTILKVIFRRLIWIVVGSAGFSGFISLFLVIFVGAAIISFSPLFDWDMTGDGKEDTGIKERFIQASENSIDPTKTEQIQYKVPWSVIAAIERVRWQKEGGEIEANQRMEELRPVFTYDSYTFENHRYTVITTCGPDGCNSYQTKLKITHPRKRLITKAETWDGIERIKYEKKSEPNFRKVGERIYHYGEYTKTFTDYLKREVYWEADQKKFIQDFSRLDVVFKKNGFLPDDRIMFAEIAHSFDSSLTLPFISYHPPLPIIDINVPYSGKVREGWGWPLSENKIITSGFGYRQWKGRSSEFHKGIDIAPLKRGVDGDPVFSASDGIVSRADWSNGGYGWVVYIRHSDGFETRYTHLSRIFVKRGEELKVGNIIGQMGNTGDSTNTHLHFEIRKSGKPINPLTLVAP